jgi:hypothetical protein
MTNQYALIGFHIDSEADFGLLMQEAYARSQTFYDTPHGHYRHWQVGNGISLWIPLDLNGKPLGLTPDFAGDCRQALTLERRIAHPERPLSGRMILQYTDESAHATLRMEIEAPDFDRFADVTVPQPVLAQMIAFAYTVEQRHASDSEAPFLVPAGSVSDEEAAEAARQQALAALKSRRVSDWVADRAYVSSNLMEADPQTGADNAGIALLSGVVRSFRSVENPVSGRHFMAVQLESLGGLLDLVCLERQLERPLAVGQVLAGQVWLGGRILNAPASLQKATSPVTSTKRDHRRRLFFWQKP